MDGAAEVRSANIYKKRLFLENPLLHPEIWNVNFTAARISGTDWVEFKSFRDVHENDVVVFSKLNKDMINPVAIELVSGPHALQKADSVLTYMHQLLMKGRNLTREHTAAELQNFPYDWKFQYMDIKTPPDFHPSQECPRWVAAFWDENKFGVWHDLRLVRCKIPPSYKTATSPANFHWVVIAFGSESSDLMQLTPPYDTIYFWHCFKCPSLNGSISMDRHPAALLKALSFPENFKSTAKTVNILNTVAETARQTTRILPPTQHSEAIPDNITRRSRNSRLQIAGRPNPLYDTNLPETLPSIRLPFPRHTSLPTNTPPSPCPPSFPNPTTPSSPSPPMLPFQIDLKEQMKIMMTIITLHLLMKMKIHPSP